MSVPFPKIAKDLSEGESDNSIRIPNASIMQSIPQAYNR